MNWEKWLDVLKTHGIATVFAGVLLWWLLTSVNAQLLTHIDQTDSLARVLLRICVNTAVIAGEPTDACFK